MVPVDELIHPQKWPRRCPPSTSVSCHLSEDAPIWSTLPVIASKKNKAAVIIVCFFLWCTGEPVRQRAKGAVKSQRKANGLPLPSSPAPPQQNSKSPRIMGRSVCRCWRPRRNDARRKKKTTKAGCNWEEKRNETTKQKKLVAVQ